MSKNIEQRLQDAEWVLQNAGFRRCDMPACNCGSWHQVGGFKRRFDEIKKAVEEAGFSTNGRTLLDTVKAVIASTQSCQCVACKRDGRHASDCAVHNEPAKVNGPCDCGAATEGKWADIHSPTCPAVRAEQ